jgi:hypothetical protein
MTNSDPRISAYVLNELSEDERRDFEAQLAINPELRREVEEVEATAGLLKEGLQRGAGMALSESRRTAIETYLRRRTDSTRLWSPRRRAAMMLIGSCAAMLLCALTLWSIRSEQRGEEAAKRRAASLLLTRLGEALKQYQNDYGVLPPDTGFGLAMADRSNGAGKRYDAGSLWRYLGNTSSHSGVTRGPYLNFNSNDLAGYDDPVYGRSYYVVDSWGTAVGYIGNPQRVVHNRGGFDLFSAGPDRKTGSTAISGSAVNLAYDGVDNNGDGIADNSAELGDAHLNGCFTVVSAHMTATRESLDDLNNWDQQN